jgi:hypothetical protein
MFPHRHRRLGVDADLCPVMQVRRQSIIFYDFLVEARKKRGSNRYLSVTDGLNFNKGVTIEGL